MFRSKKAAVYSVLLVVVTLIALTASYVMIKKDTTQSTSYSIGERQFTLLKTYQQHYNSQIEHFSLSSLILNNAILKLAQNGGYPSISIRDLETEGPVEDTSVLSQEYLGFQKWSVDSDLKPNIPSKNEFKANLEKAINNQQLQSTSITLDRLYYDTLTTYISFTSNTLYSLKSNLNTHPISITTNSIILDSNSQIVDGLITPPPSEIQYELATALLSPTCITQYSNANTYEKKEDIRKDPKSYLSDQESEFLYNTDAIDPTRYKSCRYIPENLFKKEGVLYSFVDESDYHLIFKHPEGNAMSKEMAEHLKSIGSLWWNEACKEMEDKTQCQASVFVSSISSGVHSDRSLHNVGNAIDISRCIDAEGIEHYASSKDSTWNSCKDIIKDYYNQNMQASRTDCEWTSFIYSPGDCSPSLCSTHNNHIHIQLKDNIGVGIC